MKSELTNKRISLTSMFDPYSKWTKEVSESDPMLGTIIGEDDAGHILVKWDNGSNLNVIKSEDDYTILENINRRIKKFSQF